MVNMFFLLWKSLKSITKKWKNNNCGRSIHFSFNSVILLYICLSLNSSCFTLTHFPSLFFFVSSECRSECDTSRVRDLRPRKGWSIKHLWWSLRQSWKAILIDPVGYFCRIRHLKTGETHSTGSQSRMDWNVLIIFCRCSIHLISHKNK